jgi:outer membrane protein OmpA-like peptidoglycan-associated protein
VKSFCVILLWGSFLLPATTTAQQSDTILVHFDFNRSEITSQAAGLLETIWQAHQSGRLKQIVLYGHCDFIGSNAYNDSLSQARIVAVKEFLGGKGIPVSMFSNETAYGEKKPARIGATDADRAFNRRVELVVERTGVNAEPVATPNLTERIKDSAVSSNLILENLNFEGGRHFLLPESFSILEDLLKALQNNPTVVIEIQGYVCCTNPLEDGLDLDLQTQDLSVQRAKAIYNFLIEKGIDAKRLRYQGFGGRRKIYPEELDEFQRSKNRRVEIKIISK